MSTERPERDYTPAAPQLWLYDFGVAVLTREGRWRGALLEQIRPTASDVIAAGRRRLREHRAKCAGRVALLMREVGFENVSETAVIPTPSGSFSLYRADRGA